MQNLSKGEMMKQILIVFYLIILMQFACYSIAETNNAFSLEHLQIGDSLDRVKEKKIGWEYNGLQTNYKGNLVASFSKKLLTVNLDHLFCPCIWFQTIGAHLDKNKKVEEITLIIGNTLAEGKNREKCVSTDINKCIESSENIMKPYLDKLISVFGPPNIDKESKNIIKFSWQNKTHQLVMFYTPLKSKIVLTNL